MVGMRTATSLSPIKADHSLPVPASYTTGPGAQSPPTLLVMESGVNASVSITHDRVYHAVSV